MRKIFVLTLMGFFAAQAAHADIVRLKSKVGEVNTTTGFVRLFLVNPRTNEVEPIRADVDRSTQFGGFNALRDLSEGDEVFAELNYDEYRHEYSAIQIGLLVKRGPGLLAVAPVRYQPPLVSGSPRLYQNAIEEEPVVRPTLQSGSRRLGEEPVPASQS